MSLEIVPITIQDAKLFVERHHRHHKPPVSALFAIACAEMSADPALIVGVAIVGRPVSRKVQDGWTAEVTRLCTIDDPASKHAASKLYAGCWRATRALGYRRLVTYTLASEEGTSLKAAGWREVGKSHDGKSWNVPTRPRLDWHPTLATGEGRVKWEAM